MKNLDITQKLKVIDIAQCSLDLIKSITIGLIKRQYTYSLVIEYNEKENYVNVVDITSLGEIQIVQLELKITKVHLFPNNETFMKLINRSPSDFAKFILSLEE